MQQLLLHRSNHLYNRITEIIIAAGLFCSAIPSNAQGLAYLQRGGGIVYNQASGNEHKKISLRSVLSSIEQIYDVQFAINDRLVKDKFLDKSKIKYGSIEETLKTILTPFHLQYSYVDGYYVIRDLDIQITKPLSNPLFNTSIRPVTKSIKLSSPINMAYADIKIKGKVTSSEGVALPGARISIKGTSRGTTTDINGDFQITVNKSDAVLVISYIGFKPQEVPVAGRKNIIIQLEKDVRSLKSVVITVPYGKQTAASFTGSETTLSEETFEGQPHASLQASLQGNVPGLQTMNTGQPGSSPNVRIRGIGSYSANSSPLYVVDGIPVVDGAVTTLATSSNSIAGINPNDIESVTILKDAAATSIYGSRGANGVIMITTKSGAEGKTKINATVQRGFSDLTITDRNKPLNTSEMASLLIEGVLNNSSLRLNGNPITSREDALKFLIKGGLNTDVNTDWYDIITRKGQYEQYNISASGGNKKTKFYTSLGYYKQEAVTRGQGYDRMNGRLSLNNKASERLKFNIKLAANYQKINTIPNAGSGQNPIRSLNRLVPWVSPYDKDGEYNTSLAFNPVIAQKENIYDSRIYHLTGNVQATLKILDPLSLESRIGEDFNYSDEFVLWSPLWDDGKSVNGRGRQYTSRFSNWDITNLLKFSEQYNNIGIEATLGQEASKINIKRVSTQGQDYVDPNLHTLANTSEPFIAWSSEAASSLVSYFLNATFNYKQKFHLNGTIRRDGSSRFGKNVRYGNFWSIGGAWNLDKESFLDSYTFINALKIRSSYGTSGNLVPGYYAAQGYYGTGYNYQDNPGFLLAQIENGGLTWEVNKPFDIGVDFTLFNYRLEGTVDYYSRITSSLLLNAPVSRTNGVGSLEQNIGSFKNKGVEVSLKSRNIISTKDKGFEWTTAFNISTKRNEILKLDGGKTIYDGRYIREIGGDFYEFYMKGWAGVDPNTGEALWYTDGTKKATTTDYNAAEPYKQGSALSKFFGGLTNTFSYKGLSLSFLIYYDWGGKVYDIWGPYTQSDGSAGINDFGAMTRMYYNNHWQKPGDRAFYPKVVFGGSQSGLNSQSSTRFLYDGSYIRLRNITLSYDIPIQHFHIPLTKATIYLRASNLFTYVKDDLLPYDPETYISGNFSQYIPVSRQILAGIDISF